MRRSPFLPTPALLPGRKVRLRLSPHFSTFQQPYGLKQNRSVPPAMPATWGSLVKSNVVGCANAAPPETPAFDKLRPPSGSIYLPRPDRSCRFPSSQAAGENVTNNPAPHRRGKPRTRFPLCQASSFRPFDKLRVLSFKPVIHSIPRIAVTASARHMPRQPLFRARYASRRKTTHQNRRESTISMRRR